jgi:hypothetical protein
MGMNKTNTQQYNHQTTWKNADFSTQTTLNAQQPMQLEQKILLQVCSLLHTCRDKNLSFSLVATKRRQLSEQHHYAMLLHFFSLCGVVRLSLTPIVFLLTATSVSFLIASINKVT